MRLRSLAWATAFGLLAALAVPWFLWGSATVVAGLPVWIWWHVGWLGLTALTFYAFSRTDWGLWTGVERTRTRPDGGTAPAEGEP